MNKDTTHSSIIQIGGWIKISREIRDHWIWKDSQKLKWWLDLLCLANYEANKVLIKNQLIEVERGQLVWSMRSLALRWMTTPRTIKRFLTLLERDQMVVTESVKVSTRITICNYDRYQGEVSTSDYTYDYTSDLQRRNKEKKKKNRGFSNLSQGKNQLNGYESFIDEFNQIKGSKFTYKPKKTGQQYQSRIKEGYTSDQMITALKNFMKDPYHLDTGCKHLTPEFITRSDKIEKGLNMKNPGSNNGETLGIYPGNLREHYETKKN